MEVFLFQPIHDEALKKRYQESNRFGRLGYEEKYFDRVSVVLDTDYRLAGKNLLHEHFLLLAAEPHAQ